MARRRARWRRNVGRDLVRLLVPAAMAGVVIALFAGGVADIGRASGSYHQTVDRGYGALLAVVAGESNATGAEVRVLVPSSPGVDRTALFAGFGRLTSAAADEEQALASAVPPAPAGGWSQGCAAALGERADGMAALTRAVEALLGGRTGAEAVPSDSIGAVGAAEAQLVGADAAWATCRHAASRAPGRARVPASQWWPGGQGPPTAFDLVAALQHATSLQPQHQLGVVVVTTDPSALSGASGTAAALPPTSSITVHAVVADDGNVDEPGVRITATLVPAGAAAGSSLSTTVDLSAGGSQAVVLGPFAVRQGATYTLVVTATPAGSIGAASSTTVLSVVAVPTTTTTTAPTTTSTTTPRRRNG